VRQTLNKVAKLPAIIGAANLRIRAGSPSGPVALVTISEFRTSKTASTVTEVKRKEHEQVKSGMQIWVGGKLLNSCEKWSLKEFTISAGQVCNILTRNSNNRVNMILVLRMHSRVQHFPSFAWITRNSMTNRNKILSIGSSQLLHNCLFKKLKFRPIRRTFCMPKFIMKVIMSSH